MGTDIRSKRGLLSLYGRCSPEVRRHFEQLPALLEEFPYEVALAYAFQRLELGENMALYCGLVRLHRADATVARNAIDSHHMTRQGFAELYKTIFDVDLPSGAKKDLETAERTRDTIMHGGTAGDDRQRNAIGRVLGFAGALQKLKPRTTRFMLKGMGFTIS